MRRIEEVRWSVDNLARRHPELKKQVEDLFVLLEEANRFDFEAQIEVRDIDPPTLDSSEFSYDTREFYKFSEDENGYEISVAADKLDAEKERVEEIFDERNEIRDDFRREVWDLILEICADADIRNDEGEPIGEDDLDEEDDREIVAMDFDVDAWVQQVEEYQYELRQAERGKRDSEYEEVYWNDVWFYSDIDEDVASLLGLGVGTVTQDDHARENEKFIFLQGCGMDLSPLLAAYEALVYGAVQPCHVKCFREPRYAKDVMGQDIFDQVVEKLGIAHCMPAAEDAAKARMDEFNKSMDRLSAARRAGADEMLVQMGAVMAFCKSLQ